MMGPRLGIYKWSEKKNNYVKSDKLSHEHKKQKGIKIDKNLLEGI